jgi:hypothetical protein
MHESETAWTGRQSECEQRDNRWDTDSTEQQTRYERGDEDERGSEFHEERWIILRHYRDK